MSEQTRPWQAFYGPAVRPEITRASYRTLGHMIRSVAETFGPAPAFTCCLPNGMNGTLSFAQVDEMSDALAAYLREVAGLSAGDRVAVQMPNCLSFPVAAFGVDVEEAELARAEPVELGTEGLDTGPAGSGFSVGVDVHGGALRVDWRRLRVGRGLRASRRASAALLRTPPGVRMLAACRPPRPSLFSR